MAPDTASSPESAAKPGFVHLHLHSEYSLLDGGNTISALVQRVKDLGMSAVAVTDHGNLHAAVEFYTKATEAGIKPILGIEAYVAPDLNGRTSDRTDKTRTGVADGGFHLVLLAENQQGWRNLLKLSSDSFINGFYYKPRMDKTTLAQWSDGLIAINGHLGSSIAHHLTQYVQTSNPAHWESALAEARWHAATFGTNEAGESRFFIELQSHNTEEQERINPHLIKMADELGLPLVCDNDAHFLTAESWDAHDTLCCISMGKIKEDPSRLHYSRELYVKSPEQMAQLFDHRLDAVENTVKIAERCNVEIDFETNHAPVVDVKHPGIDPVYPGEGDVTQWFTDYCAKFELLPFDQSGAGDVDPKQLKADCDKALRDLCEAGLIWRYGVDGITDQIRARLDRELQILADKLISAYFLIVWDFVNWARQRGIPANARGSGVGTMVGYVLGLSNACPERYGLLFERFTDPNRSEYPDIDIDICQDGRAACINYVREKYGHVAQIITFGRLKAKQAIKDVARVHGFTPGDGQALANLVPNELNITIDEALEKDPDFKSRYDTDPNAQTVINTARALENHARHAGVHAAGVVLATQPLDNFIPLCKASGSDDVVTQWDGPTCERVGLLKMDFLGLRTLSTIERARQLIQQTLPEDAIWNAVGRKPNDGGPNPLDLDRLHYDDPKVYELFQRGDTAGIFQFESGGMRKLLIEMKPDRLEDLIAANALFRPGPMDLIPNYNNRKHKREAVPEAHAIVEEYTAETYGIMVYQEQVMQIVHGLGDIPLRDAYTLIKAISKKKSKVIDANRPKFIEGAKEKGVSEKQANELFDLILKFAGYGFNKSHSTGYAIIAYQTAYLKTYFPNQYMAALLTFESAAKKVDDWKPYLADCARTRYADHTDEQPHVGIVVAPPDINLSQADFSVVFDEDEPRDALHGHVRFGLSAIKGAGKAAIGGIIAERKENGPFSSIHEFCERVPTRICNKATIESLVKCGTFDSIHTPGARASVHAAIEEAVAAGQTAAEDRAAGQLNMFATPDVASGPAASAPVERPLPAVPAWSQREMLAKEKETLGFHVSGHPLDQHKAAIDALRAEPIDKVKHIPGETGVIVAALLASTRIVQVRTGRSAGEKMAMITLEDQSGTMDGVVFSDTFKTIAPRLLEDTVVAVVGAVDHSRGDVQIIVEDVIPIAEAPARLAGGIELIFRQSPDGEPLGPTMQLVAGLLQQAAPGMNGHDAVSVSLLIDAGGSLTTLRPRTERIAPHPGVLGKLRETLGTENVRLLPGAYKPRNNPGKRWQRDRKPAMAG